MRTEGNKVKPTPGRPPISQPLMREVRQRCGFGCVICGLPIYEYDHLLGWSKVKRHRASEITLLCDDHHRAKTAGFLPNKNVIEANQNPRNLQNDMTKPYNLYFSGSNYRFGMGSFAFEGVANPQVRTVVQAIRIDDEPLLWVTLEDGHFLLNLRVHDSRNRLAMEITDSELVLNTHSWDIELVGTRLIIREAAGDILFDIRFNPPSGITIDRGRFLYNGVEILVAPKWAAVLNNCMLFNNVTIQNCAVGLVIDNDSRSQSAAIHFSGVPRDGWDRDAAVRWARSSVSKSARAASVINEVLSNKALDP